MHRKFIALVVATAVAITGVSASQAKAADAHDILGGLAAIAIIGAAVNHYNKEKRKERVTRQNNYVYQPQNVRPDHIRPLPRRVARYDLPQRCLKTYNGYSKKRPLLGLNCLEKHYKHANSLPQQCKVGFWDGKKVKRAYEPACLRQKGYRVVYQ
ncbi:hypothetical protein [Ruegeria sp. B32]|uniref:hypothetical protein n=1 Tax=Ruegeria sp. B32 TaxID=2867020 RepID=UPI0021A3EEA9|nr:hypothetical protein [Ruegeria sp. B32]UWR06836.1 hypothetical protein K3752_14550 [Ruegeria sp. B32]